MMKNMLEAAKAAAKQAVEALYEDECTVTAFVPTINEETGVTEPVETVLYENIPCRISFDANTAAADSEAPAIDRDATLFIAPDVDIPAGSKISITRQGMTTDYHRSGVAAMYATHQEIKLKLYEEYA